MVWCVISMLVGVVIFAAGIAFGKDYRFLGETKGDAIPNSAEMDEASLIQWKNLLNYDGNVEEEKYDK